MCEDGGDGGGGRGAAVRAAVGGVEWANEVVCAIWEEIREEVERAEVEARLLAGALGEARTRTPDGSWRELWSWPTHSSLVSFVGDHQLPLFCA